MEDRKEERDDGKSQPMMKTFDSSVCEATQERCDALKLALYKL